MSRRKEKEVLFYKNCYTALKQKRDEFRDKLVRLMRQRDSVYDQKAWLDYSVDSTAKRNEQLYKNYRFIAHGIRDEEISPIDDSTLSGIFSLISKKLCERFKDITAQLVQEIKQDYVSSMKKTMIDFVLRDYLEKENFSTEVDFCIIIIVQFFKIIGHNDHLWLCRHWLSSKKSKLLQD